jgi:predicted kinase
MSDIRKIMLESLGMVNESVYDKLKFKAVFLAGGPGSGKSFILGKAFPEAAMSNSQVVRKDERGNIIPTDGGEHEVYQSGGKWKIINSDHLFTRDLLKVDLPLDISSKDDSVMFGLQQNIRDESKKKLALRNVPWLNGMLPIILDGTCKNALDTLKIKEKLESLGYDVYMLFVDTREDVASKRNAARKRKVPDDFLRKVNNQVRANKSVFEKEFGQNFHYADNSTDWRSNPEGLNAFVASLQKFGRRVESPKINNPIGQKIVSTLEKNGGAYLADYFAPGEAKGKSGADISTLAKKDDGAPGLDKTKGEHL